MHRRAGEVKERVRGREAPQEEDGDRRLARSRGGTEQRGGGIREDGKRERKRPSSPIEPAEFYPKLGATSSPFRLHLLDILNLSFYISPSCLPLSPSRSVFPSSSHPLHRPSPSLSRYNSPRDYRETRSRQRKRASERENTEKEGNDAARKRKTGDSRRISMLTPS